MKYGIEAITRDQFAPLVMSCGASYVDVINMGTNIFCRDTPMKQRPKRQLKKLQKSVVKQQLYQ